MISLICGILKTTTTKTQTQICTYREWSSGCWGGQGGEGRRHGEMDEGVQKVQTSSYKIHK